MKFNSFLTTLLWFFAWNILLVGVLNGQTNNPRISMQGTLTDVAGKSVDDGVYNVTFRLYTTATGGTAIWQESADVTVDGGIYSYYLGSVTPLAANIFLTSLFVGLTVDQDEIIPRTELTYAPYAFAVATSNTVVCSGAVGDVKYSILNPTEFASVNGDCWVPMNGAELSPSSALRVLTDMEYLPDAGGLFVRGQEFSNGQNNDPDRTPSSSIATVQSDSYSRHRHGGTTSTDGNHTHNFREQIGSTDGYTINPNTRDHAGAHAANNDNFKITMSDRVLEAGAHNHNNSTLFIDRGNGWEYLQPIPSETRVKNLNVWIYIRIN
jgi:hypothetical protein